jgi:prevent-host-death family protein
VDSRYVSASDARKQMPDILDRAEQGEITLVMRHSKPVAAFVPVEVWRIIEELKS